MRGGRRRNVLFGLRLRVESSPQRSWKGSFQLSAVSSQLCSPAWRVKAGYEMIVRQRLEIIGKWKLLDLKEMGAGHLAAWEGLGCGRAEQGLIVATRALMGANPKIGLLPVRRSFTSDLISERNECR